VKKVSERLSYANVVSSICLFLLLSGATAFAAGRLGKNSVGTKQLKKNAVGAKQLKKNAVNGAKVKNHSLTGADIKLSKLGKVPSAADADSADTANGLSPLEGVHLVGASGEPPFLDGSANGSSLDPTLGFPPVGFYKDHEGIVHLEGIAVTGPGALGFAKIFNLPAGFRPQGGLNFFPSFEQAAPIIAGTDIPAEALNFNGGDVASKEKSIVLLSGITFRAAN
jgi:hypothetical protein